MWDNVRLTIPLRSPSELAMFESGRGGSSLAQTGANEDSGVTED